MIASSYYGELVATGARTTHWNCCLYTMVFCMRIVYELLVGLPAAANAEADAAFRSKIAAAQVMTVIRWSTYPVFFTC